MKIKNRKITDLIAAEYNPRELTPEQAKHLKDSLLRFGIVDPVIVNTHPERDNIIVGGHQRTKVWESMGNTTIPTVEVNLTPEKERELNIRLNKNSGQWDEQALQEYFNTDELVEWGFDSEEVEFFEPETTEGLIDDDEIPEVTEAITKEGDLWLLGKHRLLCGDSTKKDDVERLMDGNKADMVFTDPPYNINYGNIKHPKFKVREIENDNMSGGEFKIFVEGFVENIKFFCDGIVYCWSGQGKDGRIMFTILDEKLHNSTTIIWNKDQFTLGRGKYQNKYEPCWFGWVSNGASFTSDRTLTNVWDFKRPHKSDLHPTMKPIELCENAINHSSKKDQIIFDLFLGSGSTLIACEKTNRKCYGMELDPKYCDVIVKRWEEYTGKKAERIKELVHA